MGEQDWTKKNEWVRKETATAGRRQAAKEIEDRREAPGN